MQTDYDAIRDQIETLLNYLHYTVEFVPFSQSRNKAEKSPSLNWRVSLGLIGNMVTTDYMQGLGHCPAYNAASYRLVVDRMAVAAECERGTMHRVATGGQNVPQNTHKRIARPRLAEVVSSLVIDANVLNHASFESWASDYGYDPDSRQAEKTYQQCLKIALQLKALLRPGHLEQLQTLCQDL